MCDKREQEEIFFTSEVELRMMLRASVTLIAPTDTYNKDRESSGE